MADEQAPTIDTANITRMMRVPTRHGMRMVARTGDFSGTLPRTTQYLNLIREAAQNEARERDLYMPRDMFPDRGAPGGRGVLDPAFTRLRDAITTAAEAARYRRTSR